MIVTKSTEFADVAHEEVHRAQDLINGCLREVLGWRAPDETVADILAKS